MNHNSELNQKYKNYLIPKVEEYLKQIPGKHEKLCELLDHFSQHYIKNDDLKRDEIYGFVDQVLPLKFEIENWTRNIISSKIHRVV